MKDAMLCAVLMTELNKSLPSRKLRIITSVHQHAQSLLEVTLSLDIGDFISLTLLSWKKSNWIRTGWLFIWVNCWLYSPHCPDKDYLLCIKESFGRIFVRFGFVEISFKIVPDFIVMVSPTQWRAWIMLDDECALSFLVVFLVCSFVSGFTCVFWLLP